MAEAQRVAANITAARAQLEAAETHLRLYDRNDRPLRLNKMENEIRFVRAQIASCERRVYEYAQFEKFLYGGALFDDLGRARLELGEARLHLRDLDDERLLLIRNAPEERHVLELAVEEARQKLRDAAAGK